MSHVMKSNNTFSSILPALKYGALILAFGIGYQLASEQYPEATAIVGWVLGFLVGLKARLMYASRQ